MADDLAHLSQQHALLNRLLAGEVPTLDLIQGLLHARVEEDLHLDYKSGAIAAKEVKKAELGDPVDFDGKLKKYVAGFANSDGGVLIVGVGEPPKMIDVDSGREVVDRSLPRPIEALPWSTEQTERRAREAVGKLAVSLHPAPRIKALEVAGGSVLVVATARAEGSVFCLEHQQAVYYLRMHDSTRHAPAYLLDDLRLGRRRRPSFDLTIIVGAGLTHPRRPSTLRQALRMELNPQPALVNTGVVWMKSVQVALVMHSHGEPGTEVPRALQPYLELRQEPSTPRLTWFTASQGDENTLAPYQRLRCAADPNSPLFLETSSEVVLWAGALLVVCEDHPPTWHQLAVYCRRGEQAMWWLLPAAGRRPVVALHESEGVPGFERWSNQPDWFELEQQGGGGAVDFRLKDPVG